MPGIRQGIAQAGTPDYLWLTDADIAHAPENLRKLVARAERVARRRDSAHETAANLACRAELWLARDRIDEARAAADEARDAFQRLGMDWHRARLASLRVRLGLGDGAG